VRRDLGRYADFVLNTFRSPEIRASCPRKT
jgi:hypothetical protein